jgi:hypothetical protein
MIREVNGLGQNLPLSHGLGYFRSRVGWAGLIF